MVFIAVCVVLRGVVASGLLHGFAIGNVLVEIMYVRIFHERVCYFESC